MSLRAGVRILRRAEIVGAQMAATREGAAVLALPDGIASKPDFFDAARSLFPLDPPLVRGEDSWDALTDSLRGGLLGVDAEWIVIVWPDPWMLADGDREAGRVAVEILSDLPVELADPEITGGHTKAVTTILGAHGV